MNKYEELREYCADLVEAMAPTGGRAWTTEQLACYTALMEAADRIRKTEINCGLSDIDVYGRWTEEVWLTKKRELGEKDLTIMSLGLAGEVGEVMELLKKRVRDNTFDEKNLKKELGDVVYYWARLCRFFGFNPSEILQLNHDKIESRKERGTMQGSGNDR